MQSTIYISVTVKEVEDGVEEELILKSSEGFEVFCFSNTRPMVFEEGVTYLVALTILILDSYEISQVEMKSEQRIERLGNGFAYKIVGDLFDGCLRCCGFVFQSEALATEYAYLNDQTVAIKVDRINANFLNVPGM